MLDKARLTALEEGLHGIRDVELSEEAAQCAHVSFVRTLPHQEWPSARQQWPRGQCSNHSSFRRDSNMYVAWRTSVWCAITASKMTQNKLRRASVDGAFSNSAST